MRIIDFADGFESATEPTSIAFPASNVTNTPSGNLEAVTVQGAVNELQGDVDSINAKVGAANGIASLDSNGQVPAAQIPAVAIVNVFPVADITERDALVVEEGDVAVVADAGSGVSKTYIYGSSGWIEIIADGSLASHIADNTNPHAVTATQVGLGNVDNTSDATKNAAVAVLTNKDIDGGTASNTSRLTVPKASKATLDGLTRKEATLLYASDQKKLYVDDNINLIEVGSGSGGDINFISNPDGGTGTTGYTEGSYSAATRPTGTFTASSGASAFAISTTTTAPLGVGTTSLLLTKSSGASRQGRAVVYDFDLPLDYRAKVLNLDIHYIVNSGSFVAGSSSTDSSLIWYTSFSNDGGTTWTMNEPSSFKCLSNSATISDQFTATVQSPYDANKMRLIAYVAETANSAWVVKAIFGVKPSKYVYGTPITDWQSFTPVWSSSGTAPAIGNGSIIGYERRVGSDVEFNIKILSGTTTTYGSGTWFFGLPKKIGTQNLGSAGSIKVYNNASPFNTYLGVVIGGPGASSSIAAGPTGANWGQGTPTTLTAIAGNEIVAFGSYQVDGWSSSVQMSDSADTRVVAAKIYTSSARTMNNTSPTIVYEGVSYDTHGAYNSTTGTYTIPVTGYYKIGGTVQTATTSYSVNNAAGLQLKVNSVAGDFLGLVRAQAAASLLLSTTGSVGTYLKSGDTINIGGYSDTATTTSASNPAINYITIERLSGPSAIAASESVNARYSTDSGQSIPNTAATIIDYGTKTFDSGNILVTTGSSWKATAQISGTYRVTAKAAFAINSAGYRQLELWKNGNMYTLLDHKLSVASIGTMVKGEDEVKLLAGEYISVAGYQTSGGALTLVNQHVYNSITIERVGNY